MEIKFNKKDFKYGSNAVVLTFAVIGLVVLADLFLARFHLRKDVTAGKRYTLSLQTKKILKSLKADVHAVAFLRESEKPQPEITGLLRELGYSCGRFSPEFADPDLKPELAKRYSIKEYDMVVFESQGRRKDVFMRDMLMIDGYGRRPPLIKAEQAFANAIITVTEEATKKVYFTAGHDEKDPFSRDDAKDGYSLIRSYLETDNYSVAQINLLESGGVPGDCDVLVIAGPKRQFDPREADLIGFYLAGGGHAVFLFEPLVKTGLEKILSRWKVELGGGIAVDRFSSFRQPTIPMPAYQEHEITKELSEQKVASVLPGARRVSRIIKNETSEEKKATLDLRVEELLRTRPASWEEMNPREKEMKCGKEDLVGPFSLAVAVSDWVKTSGQAMEMKMVVAGDSDFITNEFAGIQGNIDFFLNSVNWTAGCRDKIALRPKEISGKLLAISEKQAKKIFYLIVVAMPLAVLLGSMLVWWKGRPD